MIRPMACSVVPVFVATPLVAGSYTITVPLIATLEDPAGDNPAEYELSLEVLPPSATDGGIVASTTFGCSPLTVDLSTGHPSDGAGGFSYTWDFGDGTYSILETLYRSPSQQMELNR